MPSSDPPAAPEPATAQSQSQARPQSQGGNGVVKPAATQQEPQATAATGLSPAELKKQAKAEKAARRQQALEHKAAGGTAGGAPQAAILSTAQQSKGEPQKEAEGAPKSNPSTSVENRSLPIRRPQKAPHAAPVLPKKEDKTVEVFRHLYKTRTTSISSKHKDVHPAILALGLQMGSYTICGSCARLVATLQALKKVSVLSNLHSVKSWHLLTIHRSSNPIPHHLVTRSPDISHRLFFHHKLSISLHVGRSQYLWVTLSGG